MITDINNYKVKYPTMNENSHIIENIFNEIGTSTKYFVEFGFTDLHYPYCDNTVFLKQEKGWYGLWMDSVETKTVIADGVSEAIVRKNKNVKIHDVTPDNINQLLKKYNVPNGFDFLCINTHYTYFWVWKSLEYNPYVVMIRYNPYINPALSKVIKYESDFDWDGCTNNYGASFKAIIKLGKEKGYTVVGSTITGDTSNYLFFVKDFLIAEHFKLPKTIKKLYTKPNEIYRKPESDKLIKY